MLSEPKYKHNVLSTNGTWVGGSNEWEIATVLLRHVREMGDKKARIVTFH